MSIRFSSFGDSGKNNAPALGNGKRYTLNEYTARAVISAGLGVNLELKTVDAKPAIDKVTSEIEHRLKAALAQLKVHLTEVLEYWWMGITIEAARRTIIDIFLQQIFSRLRTSDAQALCTCIYPELELTTAKQTPGFLPSDQDTGCVISWSRSHKTKEEVAAEISKARSSIFSEPSAVDQNPDTTPKSMIEKLPTPKQTNSMQRIESVLDNINDRQVLLGVIGELDKSLVPASQVKKANTWQIGNGPLDYLISNPVDNATPKTTWAGQTQGSQDDGTIDSLGAAVTAIKTAPTWRESIVIEAKCNMDEKHTWQLAAQLATLWQVNSTADSPETHYRGILTDGCNWKFYQFVWQNEKAELQTTKKYDASKQALDVLKLIYAFIFNSNQRNFDIWPDSKQ